MTQVTIYTTNQCSICRAVKSRMTARGIAYTEVNLEDDANADKLQWAKEQGYAQVPIVEHGATIYETPNKIMDFIKNTARARDGEAA